MGMQVLSAESIAALDGPATLPYIEGLTDQTRQGTFFLFLHPTTQFACAQDCVWWLSTRPVAPDRTVLQIGGCFPRDVTTRPDFAELELPSYNRWKWVAREGIGILEQLQIARGPHHYVPGPLSWRDDLVHAFDEWVLTRVGAFSA